MPIGSQKYIDNFFNEKMSKVEKSLFSLYGLGCNKNGLKFEIIAQIYNKFCQSILYYGLEANHISKTMLNKINTRQNILIKTILGLSKYARTMPLFTALKIKSILHLYDQHKLQFYRQIKLNKLTTDVFVWLQKFYDDSGSVPKHSYIFEFDTITKKHEIQYEMCCGDLRQMKSVLSSKFECVEDGLIDSIKIIIRRMGQESHSHESFMLLRLLLRNNS
jgi:hypothetical protein